MNKYLLPVDGSDNSRRAAQFLSNFILNEKDSDVVLTNVVDFKKEIYKFSPFTDIEDIKNAVIQHSKQVIDEEVLTFVREGQTVDSVVLEGDPGKEIALYAEKEGFDVIVMGTRGLSDLEGLVLGSVSHKVLHLAQCPVILVK